MTTRSVRVRAALVPLLLLAGAVRAPQVHAADPATLSEVIRAKRPVGGEYFGLYLLDKKVGYLFQDLGFAPASKDKVRSISEAVFHVNVGGNTSDRFHRETRIYEAKPNGRLLSFTVEQKGDGGDQVLEGTTTATGMTVVRKRPGVANQVMTLPLPKERVEDADQARLAILRNQKVEGQLLDGDDLGNYRVTTTVGKVEERTVGGVKVKLHQAVTLSEKEKIPARVFITDSGAMVEVQFGDTLTGRAEPESVAKRFDQAEIFGLTRVVLPNPLPETAREIPGTVTLTVTGLPDRFHKNSYRQKFRKLTDGRVEVTLMGVAPKLEKRPTRPLIDPNGGENLKSSIVVEASNPDIQAASKRILGGEKDAYLATRKILAWVHKNMVKDYGASADRASDVLRQMRGDCTEHSLLAVALLRAAGIPARRIDGVVYLRQDDGVPAFYWHEWIEAYVGEWTQLDPTFGQPVADATHFAVGEEGSAEIVALIGQLKVVAAR